MMLVRKLRLERSWSQETLAEICGLSVRTIQRIERGAEPSLETRAALAAAFDVDANLFAKEADMTTSIPQMSAAEAEALEHVRDIKGFYSHLVVYALGAVLIFLLWLVQGVSHPWFIWPILGWGIGIAAHGLSVFEVFRLFSPDWERRQVEKRLGRK